MRSGDAWAKVSSFKSVAAHNAMNNICTHLLLCRRRYEFAHGSVGGGEEGGEGREKSNVLQSQWGGRVNCRLGYRLQ